MLKNSEIKKISRDDLSRRENIFSQPLNHETIFNQPYVITEGWYPVCKSQVISTSSARSFSLLSHRFVIWRGESGNLHAMDSFCSHMGADLGNGQVLGENLRCYFHHFLYSPNGKCAQIKGKGDLKTYPVEEKYGFIWIYPGEVASHKVPVPPGLEKSDLDSIHLRTITLLVHHHVMMAGGIDLQHFKSVHNVDIKFDYSVTNPESDSFTWNLRGIIPKKSFFLKAVSYITGGEFKYQALFAGGSIVSLTYGNDLRWRGRGFKLPTVSILWASRPTMAGVSEVEVFLVMKKFSGLLAPFKKGASTLFALILLWSLRDDDIKAFPHMRFNLGHLNDGDKSVKDLVDKINTLKVSTWTKDYHAER